jgi:LPPG:FO 2-phospho-L-lactate transferase
MTVVALAGGVGGAKLADGLARLLGDQLTVVVNTGDDFEHLGLSISPDLDTVMYTLAGLANAQQGWGLAGETWNFMEQISRLGGPDWFRLGDRDLAVHAMRTQRLRRGDSLTAITTDLCGSLGIAARILPMTDDTVRTVIHSGNETLTFQDYFVRLRCEVPVTRISYEGSNKARLNPAVSRLRDGDAPSAIIICPSNPYLSIDPILAIPGVKEWIAASGAPVIAVSPIVGGTAIKGPAAKIMQELGLPASAVAIARHYRGLAAGLIVDEADRELQSQISSEAMTVLVTGTVMRNVDDRMQLAEEGLAFADDLRKSRVS